MCFYAGACETSTLSCARRPSRRRRKSEKRRERIYMCAACACDVEREEEREKEGKSRGRKEAHEQQPPSTPGELLLSRILYISASRTCPPLRTPELIFAVSRARAAARISVFRASKRKKRPVFEVEGDTEKFSLMPMGFARKREYFFEELVTGGINDPPDWISLKAPQHACVWLIQRI